MNFPRSFSRIPLRVIERHGLTQTGWKIIETQRLTDENSEEKIPSGTEILNDKGFFCFNKFEELW